MKIVSLVKNGIRYDIPIDKLQKGGPGSGRHPGDGIEAAIKAGFKRLKTDKPGFRYKGGDVDALHQNLKDAGYNKAKTDKGFASSGGKAWQRGKPYTSDYSRIVHHPDGELYVS